MAFSGLSDTQLAQLTAQNPQWELQQIRYGESQIPILIIDNFSPHTEALLKDSAAQKFGVFGPYYPGVQAHAPADYLAEHQGAIGYLLAKAFDAGDAKTALEMCMYSYVTTPPSALSPLQRYPHFDGGHPRKVALLHYLCGEAQGGTQFYRHDRTGFEFIAEGRAQDYARAREEDAAEFGLRGPAYFAGSEHGFTRLAKVSARFNRAVLYPSASLHSGDLGTAPKFSASPDTGRLTVNTFIVPA